MVATQFDMMRSRCAGCTSPVAQAVHAPALR